MTDYQQHQDPGFIQQHTHWFFTKNNICWTIGNCFQMKREIQTKGILNLKHGKYEYPITYQLIKDGRKNKILNKSFHQRIKVTMVHGKKDESVPVLYSKKILKLFKNAKKKLIVVKNGDHSLSKPRWLKIIKNEIKLMI